ncbi:MAG: hypothetical protein J2P58_05765 [Acidimicrobiaceae bacterium]|nr:hypothetical protein [Acidimicrobiaceae bacterium]MBO0746908.1 hypothetical protein [Acidimicrobiaceae bacterium]
MPLGRFEYRGVLGVRQGVVFEAGEPLNVRGEDCWAALTRARSLAAESFSHEDQTWYLVEDDRLLPVDDDDPRGVRLGDIPEEIL